MTLLQQLKELASFSVTFSARRLPGENNLSTTKVALSARVTFVAPATCDASTAISAAFIA